MAGGAATWSVKTPGFASFRRQLAALGETDTPHMRRALDESGQVLAAEMRSGAPGSMKNKVDVGQAKGKGAAVRIRVAAYHPGAKAREFGRTTWYRSSSPGNVVGIGNNTRVSLRRRGAFKGGKASKYKKRSVASRPFVGVKDGGHAIGRAEPRVRALIERGMLGTWAEVLGRVDE